MHYQIELSDVSSQYGAPMGRRDTLPDDRSIPVKLHLNRLVMEDYAYDQGGAYWGMGSAKSGSMYMAEAWLSDDCNEYVQVFIRARDRDDAKAQIRKVLPNVRFYR